MYNNRIQRLTGTGSFLNKWGAFGGQAGQFNRPRAAAIDDDGFIYVSDWGNHRIQKFTKTGGFIAQWGGEGSGDGQFNSPAGIDVDGNGTVFVADWGNARVQAFDNDGTFLFKFGTPGSGPGQLNGPLDVRVDRYNNVLYVADANNDRIQKFSINGVFLLKWGTIGSSDGQFNWPNGVAVDANGSTVVVCDSANHRIQVFSYGPTGIGARLTGNIVLRCYPNPFTSAANITFTLSTGAKARVSVYDVHGRLVAELANRQLPAGPNEVPWSIARDHDDKVPSGVYFVRVDAGSLSGAGRIVLLR